MIVFALICELKDIAIVFNIFNYSVYYCKFLEKYNIRICIYFYSTELKGDLF